MENLQISVVIPLYNHENYIEEAIRSVLDQQIDRIEIIIIDDGSLDRSPDIVSAIRDRRIRFYSQENKGAHDAINRGIRLAEGKYIAILNSDDLYYPDRLAICLDYLENEKSVDALCTKVEAIDASGNHLYYFQTRPSCTNNDLRSHPDQLIALDLLGVNVTTTTSNLVCRKEVFDQVGMFRSFRYCHDLDWLLRCVTQKHVRIFPEPLLRYRFHGANTIMENSAMVCFEVGLVLTDFFVAHREGCLPQDMNSSWKMTEIYRSLQFAGIDRMLSVLGITVRKNKEWYELMTKLLNEENDPFRVACLESIQASLQDDKERDFLRREHARLSQELKSVKETNELLQRSISCRIGRLMTWPARCFFQGFRKNSL